MGVLVLNPDTLKELKSSRAMNCLRGTIEGRGSVVGNSDNLLEGEIKSAGKSGLITS